MRFWELYIATCRPTGKQYVGQSGRTFYARWGWHVSSAQAGKNSHLPLVHALREYGPHEFTIEVLACARSKVDASFVEALLIAQYRTLWPDGYNLTKGVGQKGVKLTDEQREMRRKVGKRMWADPVKRAEMIAGLKRTGPSRGRKIAQAFASPERRQALIATLNKARDSRARGDGVRSHRTIRDRRQPDLF